MSTPLNNNLTASLEPFSKVAAFVASFFFLPFFHRSTIGFIETFTAQHYGTSSADYVYIGWYAVGFFFVYLTSWFLISLALKLLLTLPKLLILLIMMGRG